MNNFASFPNDLSAYLEALMQAGQRSAKQFDDALALAMGGKEVLPRDAISSPVSFVAELHREYLMLLFRFWAAAFNQIFTMGSPSRTVEPARSDKRFKDEAWQDIPYYDLLKQSYLLGSKQLKNFVEQAQVD